MTRHPVECCLRRAGAPARYSERKEVLRGPLPPAVQNPLPGEPCSKGGLACLGWPASPPRVVDCSGLHNTFPGFWRDSPTSLAHGPAARVGPERSPRQSLWFRRLGRPVPERRRLRCAALPTALRRKRRPPNLEKTTATSDCMTPPRRGAPTARQCNVRTGVPRRPSRTGAEPVDGAGVLVNWKAAARASGTTRFRAGHRPG